MPNKLKVPYYAKLSAILGLEQRKKNKAGLTKKEADKLGIVSGVEQAKKIIKRKYLYKHELKRIARFYARFRKGKTKKIETAINLWGGRMFGNLLYKIYIKK